MGPQLTGAKRALGPRDRAPGEPGPLSRDAVLARALDIINLQGVERLTLRRLAAELGVSPMAIYRHVANKADLLDGVLDLLMREADVTAHDEEDWLDWLCETFLRMRVTLLAQSGALALIVSRASLGPQGLGVIEAVLARLAQRGIPRFEAARVFHHLMTYTLGSVAMLGPILQQDPALADPDERARRIRANFELLPGRQFPQLTRHGAELAAAFRDDAFAGEIRRIAKTARIGEENR
ncbi:MAG: TetR family transcriptional regulator [Deltaproteobacteria bacterium]|nr:TetR family transcriptional regulator [Deltaproteobacteria bacterium]